MPVQRMSAEELQWRNGLGGLPEEDIEAITLPGDHWVEGPLLGGVGIGFRQGVDGTTYIEHCASPNGTMLNVGVTNEGYRFLRIDRAHPQDRERVYRAARWVVGNADLPEGHGYTEGFRRVARWSQCALLLVTDGRPDFPGRQLFMMGVDENQWPEVCQAIEWVMEK